ncbi:MAG: dethiobiotin synthase [Proteobacteria bacterium]|jgi:dethiobiotin synthetase|nr:dethiobiotin synthase [Pseudomonadota bacterium]MDA1298986.1 dethiobiotin synthase [Pseudomonadota bacterium]
MNRPNAIFVSGTNTDIGKTVVSGIIVAGLNAHYWKPVQTGLADGTDTDWIRSHTGISESRVHPETYRLLEPLSPHAAAAIEEVEISLDHFELPPIPDDETLVIEGAGGILVPLNDQHYMLDLIVRLGVPVLLVVSSELGTINHTLLTLRVLREHRVPILGVVMNGPSNPGNRSAIEHFGEINVIAEVEPLTTLSRASLAAAFRPFVWPALPTAPIGR